MNTVKIGLNLFSILGNYFTLRIQKCMSQNNDKTKALTEWPMKI
jgi:hypothetical protein